MSAPSARAALRNLAYRAAARVYGALGAGRSRHGLRVLTYHAVGSAVEGDGEGMFSIAPQRFAAQMQALARQYAGRFQALDAAAQITGSTRIAVSFDDGYRDNLTVAAPLLAELGIPFTVFIGTGFVASGRDNFLSPAELKQLAAVPGATIGAHSVSHVPLTRCDDARLRAELGDSKRYLEDLLGRPVQTLAYPHGDVDRRVRDFAQAAGYTIAATTRFDINTQGRDPLLLCRTDIWSDDDERVFQQKLHGDWDWYRWRRADPASGTA